MNELLDNLDLAKDAVQELLSFPISINQEKLAKLQNIQNDIFNCKLEISKIEKKLPTVILKENEEKLTEKDKRKYLKMLSRLILATVDTDCNVFVGNKPCDINIEKNWQLLDEALYKIQN